MDPYICLRFQAAVVFDSCEPGGLLGQDIHLFSISFFSLKTCTGTGMHRCALSKSLNLFLKFIQITCCTVR